MVGVVSPNLFRFIRSVVKFETGASIIDNRQIKGIPTFLLHISMTNPVNTLNFKVHNGLCSENVQRGRVPCTRTPHNPHANNASLSSYYLLDNHIPKLELILSSTRVSISVILQYKLPNYNLQSTKSSLRSSWGYIPPSLLAVASPIPSAYLMNDIPRGTSPEDLFFLLVNSSRGARFHVEAVAKDGPTALQHATYRSHQ